MDPTRNIRPFRASWPPITCVAYTSLRRAPTVIQPIGIEDRRDRARSMPIGGKEGEPEIEEQLTDPAGEALASIPTVFETLVDEPVQRGRPPQSQIDGRRPWRLVIPSALNAAGRSR